MATTNTTSTNTTSVKKVTKAMRFAELLTYAEVKANPEMVEFINHEIDLLSRKNASGEKKPTKAQAENKALQDAIYEKMEDNRLYTITELIKEIPELGELTNQKVTALMRALKAEGKVDKKEDKRKSVYFVIR